MAAQYSIVQYSTAQRRVRIQSSQGTLRMCSGPSLSSVWLSRSRPAMAFLPCNKTFSWCELLTEEGRLRLDALGMNCTTAPTALAAAVNLESIGPKLSRLPARVSCIAQRSTAIVAAACSDFRLRMGRAGVSISGGSNAQCIMMGEEVYM